MNMYNKIKLNNVENVEFFDVELLRNEKLIMEREEYEKSFFSLIDEISELDNTYNCQIASREQVDIIEDDFYDYVDEDYSDYEYDQYEEDMFWELHYLRQNQFQAPNPCECMDLDYMPYDDKICDYLDCYDYPEGPEENLCGVKYY